MASFGEWANSMGIDYSKLNPAQQSGLAQSYGNLVSVGDTASMNNPVGTMNNFDKGAYLSNVTADNTTMGLDNNTWGGIGTGLQIGTGLMNAFTGMKQLGLQKDAFNFNKQMQEKQYGLAKDAYDRAVRRADSIWSQMQAGKVA